MSVDFMAEGPPAVAAILLAAAAALWLLVLERRQTARRRAAMLAALAALLLLYLRPALRVAGSPAEALLLTPGAAGSPPAAGPARVLAAASASPATLPPTAEVAPDPAALWRSQPEIARLTVAGHGLRAYEWSGFAGTVEPLAPPALPPGVADVLWRRRLDLGEPLVVEGRLVSGGVGGRLALHGPGGPEETLEIRETSGAPETLFRLEAHPRTAGTHLYHLELRDGETDEVAWREPLDIEVVMPPPLRLLLVESAPSFETRHLEALLAARGAVYTLRTKVSRGRYRYEYQGRAPSTPSFAAAELAELDALVADPETLADLAESERRELRRALAGGLGLLVLPRRGLGPWPPWTGPQIRAQSVGGLADGDRLTVRLRWPGTVEAPPLGVEAREIVVRGAAAPLVEDASGRALAAIVPEGRGQVAAALAVDSYRWALAGEARVHAEYWAHLLGAVARTRGGPRWEIGGGPVVAGEPLPVGLRGSRTRPAAAWWPPGAAQAESVALRQDPSDPEVWEATLWPRPGWNRLEAGAATAALYAAPAGAWPVLDLARRQRETARRSLRGESATAGSGASSRVPRELPRWPFYALFLAAVLYLWVGERLRLGW